MPYQRRHNSFFEIDVFSLQENMSEMGQQVSIKQRTELSMNAMPASVYETDYSCNVGLLLCDTAGTAEVCSVRSDKVVH